MKIWVFALFLIAFDSYSQQVEQDSVQLIQNYQAEARNAIAQQDHANKLAVANSDHSFKESLQLEIAELHYFLQNYHKANSETDLAINYIDKGNSGILKAHAFNLKGLILTK